MDDARGGVVRASTVMSGACAPHSSPRTTSAGAAAAAAAAAAATRAVTAHHAARHSLGSISRASTPLRAPCTRNATEPREVGLPSTARSMMAGWVFLVLTGACQFGHGVDGFDCVFRVMGCFVSG